MVNYKCKFSTISLFINHTYVKTNKEHIVIFWQKNAICTKIRHDFGGNHDLISSNHEKHPSESSGILLLHLSEFRVRKRWCPISQVTNSRNFCCYWIFILFYRVDTASSPRCYCSISRIHNRRFSSWNNPPAWAIHSLKSIHSHSTLSHTDIYRFGASLCYRAASSITGKSVRHLEWVCNSCYCIEVFPRVHVKFRRERIISTTNFVIFSIRRLSGIYIFHVKKLGTSMRTIGKTRWAMTLKVSSRLSLP